MSFLPFPVAALDLAANLLVLYFLSFLLHAIPRFIRRLSQDPDVQDLIRAFHEQGKLIGMICAGTLAAKTSGIAFGQRLTSHPSVKGDLEKRESSLGVRLFDESAPS